MLRQGVVGIVALWRQVPQQQQRLNPGAVWRLNGLRGMSFYNRKKRANDQVKQVMIKSKGQQMIMMEEGKEIIMGLRQSSLGQVHDPWVPVPKDRAPPLFSGERVRGWWEHLKKRAYSIYGAGMIRYRFEKGWDSMRFAADAEAKYLQLAAALASKDLDKAALKAIATDDCVQRLKNEFGNKAHSWELVNSVERPQVAHINLIPVNHKDNIFAQITVRLHLRTRVAQNGQPPQERDQIDYIVMERHLAKPESTWRIAGNIIPLFMLPVEEQQRIRQRQQALVQQAKDAARKAKAAPKP